MTPKVEPAKPFKLFSESLFRPVKALKVARTAGRCGRPEPLAAPGFILLLPFALESALWAALALGFF